MASIRKRGSSWHVLIKRLGIRKSGTFSTKIEAQNWAAATEADIIAGKTSGIPDKTFGDLLSKYAEEVSPGKRGARWEIIRINKYLKDKISEVHLRDLNSSHFADWRDRRLKEVGNGSVLREWNILSNACKVARDEWKWMTDNPIKPVSKPKKPPARKRIASQEENQRMGQCAGYSNAVPLTTATLRMFAGYLFSIETALRAGELCALDRHEAFKDKGYLKVTGIKPGARKNNAAVRDVPMTPRAIEILEQVLSSHNEVSVFNISVGSLDTLFRKVRDRSGIVDLTYHDSRHAAITAMAQSGKYNVLELARIVGHTNLNELMTYFNPTIEELVQRGRPQEVKLLPAPLENKAVE